MIGYYVHHHGSGHRHRALAIAQHLGRSITLLGSLGPAASVPARYVELPRDDRPRPDPTADVTAGGALHWAPLHHLGQRSRQQRLAGWLASSPVDLLVSDVSVEALLLARLLGVPPVAVALRGHRLDRAHAAGYDAAVRILAPWPKDSQHEWPARWLAKTTWLGMLSRFDGRQVETAECDRPGLCVVLMLGRGGHQLGGSDVAEAAAVAGVHWHLLGAVGTEQELPDSPSVVVHGQVTDPWAFLCSADVVVATAGDAAIADAAAARAALIAVPQPRPYDEQVEHARILEARGLCVATAPWPKTREWPRLLARASELGGGRWAEQSDGSAARRAADTLTALTARRVRGEVSA